MTVMMNEEQVAGIIQKVRDKGHTAVADVELKLTITLAIARNPKKSDDEIADMVAEALGLLGGSTSGSDVAFEKGQEKHDKKLNDKSIYDTYTKDAWKTDKL